MIKASQRICHYCNKNGAGLTCFKKSNSKSHCTAHYLCAQLNGWKFNWLKYKMLCEECRPIKKWREVIGVELESEADDPDYENPEMHEDNFYHMIGE